MAEHIHIEDTWNRTIECKACSKYIEFLENIRGHYGNLLTELEYSYRSHLVTVIITTIVVYCLMTFI
jgi:hypothetical protein